MRDKIDGTGRREGETPRGLLCSTLLCSGQSVAVEAMSSTMTDEWMDGWWCKELRDYREL